MAECECGRVVGTRKCEPEVTGPSAANLARGEMLNALGRQLPTGNTTFVPRRGVMRFKSHEETNAFDEECIVAGVVATAKERRG